MSDTSRVSGFGGFSGGGQEKGRSTSLVRFCRGRKLGDIVSGVFLRLESETLGWALLEGEELLAHLPAGVSRPEVGSSVFFRIEALYPEVTLRLLPAASPEARLAAFVPSLPLAQEAALYVAARDTLDSMLVAHPVPGAASTGGGTREEGFIQHVSRSPDLFAAFVEVQIRSRALLHSGASAGLSFFRHMPWISPTFCRLEVSLWNKGGTEVVAGGLLPSGDTLLLQGHLHGGVLHYRFAFSPAKAGYPVGAVVHEGLAHSGIGKYQGMLTTDCSGTGGQTADLVGRILALAVNSGATTGVRFSRRV